MRVILICLFALIAVQIASACYAKCNYCTCAGNCGYPQTCSGVGPDCYCSSIVKRHPDHAILSELVETLCLKINQLTSHDFIVPLYGNNSVKITCNIDDGLMVYLHEKN